MNEENKEIMPTEEDFEGMLSRAEEKREQRQKNKKKKAIKITLISVLSVILAAALVFGSVIITEMNGSNKKTIILNVEKGSSAYQIADDLEQVGAIKSATLFRAYCKIKGYGQDFKFGSYEIKEKSSYKDIAKALSKQGETVIVRVTIPEGTGIYDYVKNVNGNNVTIPGVATLLEKAGVCKKDDFFEAVKSTSLSGYLLADINKDKTYVALEGYIFPDTYQFYAYESKECAKLAVEKMIENMRKKFTSEMVERAQEINMSVNEVLTLASIIQMEAGNAGDAMPKVAAVFYNRLNRGEKLGSSPTCYYGNAFKGDDGRYDTYKVLGLPPGPLCTVGSAAINAVLYPEKNFEGYFYFVTDSSGKFYFHKTYNQQVNTINRLKRENKWIYEYLD